MFAHARKLIALPGLNNILLINCHIQHDKDIYCTGSDRKLKAYINHLLKNILTGLIYIALPVVTQLK